MTPSEQGGPPSPGHDAPFGAGLEASERRRPARKPAAERRPPAEPRPREERAPDEGPGGFGAGL